MMSGEAWLVSDAASASELAAKLVCELCGAIPCEDQSSEMRMATENRPNEESVSFPNSRRKLLRLTLGFRTRSCFKALLLACLA